MRLIDPEIGAVFTRREDAEAAVDDLYDAGLADDHLWRAAHSSRHRAVDDDMDRVVLRSVAFGIAIGSPVGAVIGMLLVTLGAAGAGVVPTSTAVLLAGTFGGFMAGMFFGIVAGVARETRALYGREPWSDVPLSSDEMLVVTHAHGQPAVVREVFEEHGGRLIDATRRAA